MTSSTFAIMSIWWFYYGHHIGTIASIIIMITIIIYIFSTITTMNAIIANRALGDFSKNPNQVIRDLILYTLEKMVS